MIPKRPEMIGLSRLCVFEEPLHVIGKTHIIKRFECTQKCVTKDLRDAHAATADLAVANFPGEDFAISCIRRKGQPRGQYRSSSCSSQKQTKTNKFVGVHLAIPISPRPCGTFVNCDCITGQRIFANRHSSADWRIFLASSHVDLSAET